jgi:hypothetical protein
MANGRTKTASFGPSYLGAILLFCAFAVVAWILFRFAAPSQTYEEKRADDRRAKVATINAEAAQKLYGPPQWIDKTKGTVQLPIDVAMDLVVNDYQSKPVQASAVKVENPYPAGLQSPAAAAAPAVSGSAAPATTGSSAPASASPSPMTK